MVPARTSTLLADPPPTESPPVFADGDSVRS